MMKTNHRRQIPERVRRAIELRQGARTTPRPSGRHAGARKTIEARALREQEA